MNATEMAGLLKDVDRRSALIDEIVAMVVRTGADGADIDFESMNFGNVGADRTAVKKFYPIFLDKLRDSPSRDGGPAVRGDSRASVGFGPQLGGLRLRRDRTQRRPRPDDDVRLQHE